VVDTDERRARALVDALEPELAGVELRAATDPESAVREAEIVCCATNATSPLFAESALPAHVHVNAIGAYRPTMRELPDELLATSTVVIDELDAILAESGEIIHALKAGAITQDALTELGSALIAPSTEYGKRTVFKTVGVAMQDWAIAHLLADKLLP
jgi:ornithine cyclodeaminase